MSQTKALRLIILLIIGVVHAPELPASSTVPSKVQTVTLSLQERTNLDASKLSIHFVGYRDDRCPSDVQCAWAGEARAFFWVSGSGIKPQILTLLSDDSPQPNQNTRQIGAYRFYLRSLEPRPRHDGSVIPSKYKAVLQVGR